MTQSMPEIVPGTVLEYYDAREITCGVCLAVKSQRLSVLSMSNREVNLSAGRVLHAGGQSLNVVKLSRDELAAKLRDIDRLRKDLMERVDIEELWSLLDGQEEGFTTRECGEFIFSDSLTDDHVASVQRCLLEDRIYFQHRDALYFARASEKIDQRRQELEREEEKAARLEAATTWAQALWNRKGRITLTDEHKELLEDLKQFCLHGQDSTSYTFIKEVLKKANIPIVQQSAFRMLVRLGIWTEDENLFLHELGITADFPEPVEKLAVELSSQSPVTSSPIDHRRDLRDLHAVTIDSAQTRDLDDALSLRPLEDGTFEVGIHIADAAEYVRQDDPLDEEAKSRATSIYLPDSRISMLPHALSEGICSLIAGADRLAMSFLLHVDEQGNILNSEICPSIIRIKEKLTYQEVNEKFESNAALGALHKLALLQRDQRVARGAINLPLPEIQVYVLSSGMIQLYRHEKETPSQLMVSEWMISANGIAAAYLADRSIPSIFRSQVECKPETDPVHSDHEIFHHYRQRRLFARAELNTIPQTHCSLGMAQYTTVTSPIRRYSDLIVQRQLKAALLEAPPPYSEEELKQLILQLGALQSKISLIQRKWTRYWILKYMEQEDIQTLNALVLDRNGRYAHLLLPDFLMETSVPVTEAIDLQRGSMIKVRVDRVSPREEQLRASLPELRNA